MLYTSYFANIKKFPENVIPVAICAVVPNWYRGLCYASLAPRYDDLMKYKDDHNEADYIQCYNDAILKNLNPLYVVHTLQALRDYETNSDTYPFWESPDAHIALICYEKPSDFCHRQLIAKWFNDYGIECKEWNPTHTGDE